MLDKFLEIEHRAELSEHFECAEGEVFVVEARDAAALAAEEGLEHYIAAKLFKREHGFVGRLAADGARREQVGGLELGGGEKFIDGGFDGTRGVDDDSAGGLVAGEAVHPEDDLLKRARGHGADERGVEIGEVAASRSN